MRRRAWSKENKRRGGIVDEEEVKEQRERGK